MCAPVCRFESLATEDDNDKCTIDSCAPATGPAHTPISGIDDGNVCTADTCDPATGNISHDPIAGIDDGIACTTDKCDPATGTITHDPTPECCGNGTLEPWEACDDGNLIDDAACTSMCTIPPCGNGTLDAGEECDDHNAQNGDGCNSSCKKEVCGNGVVDFGEQCDDGNAVETDNCAINCRPPPPPPTAIFKCSADPKSIVVIDGKNIIFPFDKDLKRTLVTLEVLQEPASGPSDKSQILVGLDTVELHQTSGSTPVNIEGVGPMTDSKLVMKGVSVPGLSPLTYQFKSPIPDAPKIGIEPFGFLLVGKDTVGAEKFKVSAECLIGLTAMGGGGTGGQGGCALIPEK